MLNTLRACGVVMVYAGVIILITLVVAVLAVPMLVVGVCDVACRAIHSVKRGWNEAA
jgi:hypothetical protein